MSNPEIFLTCCIFAIIASSFVTVIMMSILYVIMETE